MSKQRLNRRAASSPSRRFDAGSLGIVLRLSSVAIALLAALLLAARANAIPAVLAPADGATGVIPASEVVVLEPHDGYVWEIRFARSPRTEEEALGLPPGTGPDLYEWEARLGVQPGLYGLYRGATRYPLAAIFTVRQSPEGRGVTAPYTFTPGRTYWYRLKWAPASDTDPLAMYRYEWGPIRSLTIAAPPPASPQPTTSTFTPIPRSWPVLRGRPRVGNTLICVGGRFLGARSTRVRWLRNNMPIAAQRRFYRLKKADLGRRVRCRVTGIGQGANRSIFSRAKLVLPAEP